MFHRIGALVAAVLGFWGAQVVQAATISGTGSFTSNGGLTISGGAGDAYGILAINGPRVVISGAKISINNPAGPGPIGLKSEDKGTFISWTNSQIHTMGAASGGAFADSGSMIVIQGGSIATESFGLKVRSASLSATNSDIRVTRGDGATIVDTPLDQPASLKISGGRLIAGGDAFRVSNAVADILIEDGADVRPGADGRMLNVTTTSDRSSVVTFDVQRVSLAGDIVSDSASRTSVTLARQAQLAGSIQSASLQIDGSSRWTMTGSSVVQSLGVVSGGVVQFATPVGAGFKRLVVQESLSGAGQFGLNVNLGRNEGDRIVVQRASSGSSTLAVTNQGAAPTRAGLALKVVDTSDGGARFKLAGGKLESGALVYRLVRGGGAKSTPDPTDWYLANSSSGSDSGGGAGVPELSAAGRAIVNTAGAQALTWLGELDTLEQRLGDLRLGLTVPPTDSGKDGSTKAVVDAKDKAVSTPGVLPGGDIWVRGYGRRMNADTGLTGEAFSQYVYGVDLGFDRAFRLDGSWLVTGLSGGWGGASRSFDTGGSGLTESVHGSVYATWLSDAGWYLDGVGKLNYFDNRFDAVSGVGDHSQGHYGNWAFGFSLEGGRQFQLGNGWYLEPKVQTAYTHLSAANYSTSDEIAVRLGGEDVFQMRAGMSIGKRMQTKWGVLQPFVKVGYIETLSEGGNLSASGYSERPTLDGSGVEAGAGVIMQMSERAQLYGEYQFVAAERYTQPWSVSGGFRWLW